MITKIDLYIAKKFLINKLFTVLSILSIFFIVNILENIDSSRYSLIEIITISVLQIPSIFNDILVSLIILSAVITFAQLSLKSEIVVMRTAGLSLFKIASPAIFVVLITSIVSTFSFENIAIKSNLKLKEIQNSKNTDKNKTQKLYIKKDIWLKQNNIEEFQNGKIIIKISSINLKNMTMLDGIFWFFDNQNNYYKRVYAKNLFLNNNVWHLNNVIISDKVNINNQIDNIKIKTHFNTKHVLKKINNILLYNPILLFKARSILNSLEEFSHSTLKISTYYYSLLAKPLICVSMVILSICFSVNNTRNSSKFLSISIGVSVAFLVYILLKLINIIAILGVAPVFISVFVSSIILLNISILILLKKDYDI